MIPTIYLLFPDATTAQTEMVAAGYRLSQYNDHFEIDREWIENYLSGLPDLGVEDPNLPRGWGSLLPGKNGHEVNVYDAHRVPARLEQFKIPAPITPNSVRAGDY